MVRIFTHRKRTYWGCERCRVDFKITVDHINFKTNQYFLANSHYVIFRKENKNKQFVSRNKVSTAAELKMVHVDEKIKFRACMLQDTPHRYLEKYLPKLKRFIVRQVTETKDEELYVNCGYFELPLDIYGMKPSGQEVVVNFVDPDGKASGTVLLKVEHEPRVAMANYLPNFSKTFQQLLTPKVSTKTHIAGSRLEANREKLEFIKQKRMVDHWSHKYDGLSDSESEAEETLSESDASETDENTKKNKRLPTKSFIMNRTGMPQMSTKGGSSKHHVSAMLRSHMFNFGEEDEGEEMKMPPQENASHSFDDDEGDQKVNTVSFYETVTHFEPEDTDVKANSLDSCSTLTESEQHHLSPRVEPSLSEGVLRKPSVEAMRPAQLNMTTGAVNIDHQEDYIYSPPRSPHAPQVIGHLMPGNTHVPFSHQPSYKVRASSFLICESEDEVGNAGKMPAIELRKENKLEVVEEEELWEDPADFDRLEEENEDELVLEGGSYKPRKSLRTVPPPLISDKSQFIPARTVQRSTSVTSASMHTSEGNLPKYEPPPAVPQPPRKSLRGVPPPVPEKESFVPARVVHRANSDKSIQLEHSNAFDAAPSAYVSSPPANLPLKSYQSEYHVRQPMEGNNKQRTPSPAVRHLVPVRLSAQESASLVSPLRNPTESAPKHVHTHHRAASTGDMYAGIGHRHLEDAHMHNVSVKELRRNFERPPLVKDNSNGSGDKLYPPLSPKTLPVSDQNIRFQRGNSERSFSTLSTHTELDRQKHQQVRNHGNGAPAKVLVPVRLQNSHEEQAFKAHEAVRSPQSVASFSQAPQHHQVSQDYNHSRSYREEPPLHHVNHHQSHNNQAHAEQYDRYQRYHEAQEPNYHHQNTSNTHNHSKLHPQVHGHSQSHHHIQQSRQDIHQHDHNNNHKSHHAGADAPHTLHRAHTMAPPIRLKANDYVPPVYERYVEHPHSHIHVHHDSHHSHAASQSAFNSPRDDEYTARSLHSAGSAAGPAAYRSVYA